MELNPWQPWPLGFISSELLNQNFASKIPGQFVLEMTGCCDLGIAADYDVKAKLEALQSETSFKVDINQFEAAPEAILAEMDGERWPIEHFDWKLDQMISLLHENQDEQFRQIWEVSPGPGREYKKAKAERTALVRHMQSAFCKDR